MEQKNKTRVRVKIAVIFVLALHGIGLLALLMQGCGHENAGTPGSTPANSNSTAGGTPEPAPSFAAPSNPPETAAATAPTSTTSSATAPAAAPANPAPGPLPPETPNVSAATPLPGGSDYKIAKGDTLSKIARKFHVGLPALQAANPGAASAKLKIGQTIHIPAPAAAAAAPSGPGAATGAASDSAGGQQVYTVKSSDTLIKIAREFGVKVKVLRAANNLKTDKIKVGQKLKIPPKTAAASEAAPSATGPSGNAAAPSGR